MDSQSLVFKLTDLANEYRKSVKNDFLSNTDAVEGAIAEYADKGYTAEIVGDTISFRKPSDEREKVDVSTSRKKKK